MIRHVLTNGQVYISAADTEKWLLQEAKRYLHSGQLYSAASTSRLALEIRRLKNGATP